MKRLIYALAAFVAFAGGANAQLLIANYNSNTIREYVPDVFNPNVGVDRGDFAATRMSNPWGVAIRRGEVFVANASAMVCSQSNQIIAAAK